MSQVAARSGQPPLRSVNRNPGSTIRARRGDGPGPARSWSLAARPEQRVQPPQPAAGQKAVAGQDLSTAPQRDRPAVRLHPRVMPVRNHALEAVPLALPAGCTTNQQGDWSPARANADIGIDLDRVLQAKVW